MSQFRFDLQEKPEAKEFTCEQINSMEMYRVVRIESYGNQDKRDRLNKFYINDIIIKIKFGTSEGESSRYSIVDLTKGIVLDNEEIKTLRIKKEWSVRSVMLIHDFSEKPCMKEESKESKNG